MARILATTFVAAALALPAAGQSTDFRWTGNVDRGKTLEIKGVGGDIRVELSSNNQVEVVATKHARRSDPESVSVQVVQGNGNVTICAVYPTPTVGWGRRGRDNQPNECRSGDGGHMNVRDNDVKVDFTVRLPQGVRLEARTVNGEVDARGLKSDADVQTVNGKVFLSTTGKGSAKSVNGAIEASIGELDSSDGAEFVTVNGSITVTLPKSVNADVHARLVNGRFNSDVPITVRSFHSRNRQVDGTIGTGGSPIDLHTVNGSISLLAAR